MTRKTTTTAKNNRKPKKNNQPSFAKLRNVWKKAFPSDIPRARKPITVDNSQWKEQPWKHTPKNQLQYGPVRYPNTSAAMSSNARFLWESSFAMRLSRKPVSSTTETYPSTSAAMADKRWFSCQSGMFNMRLNHTGSV